VDFLVSGYQHRSRYCDVIQKKEEEDDEDKKNVRIRRQRKRGPRKISYLSSLLAKVAEPAENGVSGIKSEHGVSDIKSENGVSDIKPENGVSDVKLSVGYGGSPCKSEDDSGPSMVECETRLLVPKISSVRGRGRGGRMGRPRGRGGAARRGTGRVRVVKQRSELKRKRVACKYCGEGYVTLHGLRRHLEEEHGEAPPPKVQWCGSGLWSDP